MAAYTLPVKTVLFNRVYTLLCLILLTYVHSSPCLVQLVSVEGLWEQGLCASNFEGSWISKTWAKGVGNLNVSSHMNSGLTLY